MTRFFPQVIIRRSRPSVVALLSNGNHQSRWFRREPENLERAFHQIPAVASMSRVSSEDQTACRSRCSRHSYLHQGLSSTQQHQWPCTVPSLRKRASLPELDACALIPHTALMRAAQQSA